MPVSGKTYEQVVLEDPSGGWELWCGELRRKPLVTTEHGDVIENLSSDLYRQVDRREYAIRSNDGRLRISSGTFYVPDLCVIPRSYVRRLLQRPGTFEVYEGPALLVIEVWSPSTGEYDVQSKLPEYQRRGDREIWFIHPYERTLTSWRLQSDGGDTMSIHGGGVIEPVALAGARIEIERLFE